MLGLFTPCHTSAEPPLSRRGAATEGRAYFEAEQFNARILRDGAMGNVPPLALVDWEIITRAGVAESQAWKNGSGW